LVPSWQSQERHRKLHVMMQDRPDLIKSELAGLAFDSLQQIFRKADIAHMMSADPLPFVQDQTVWIVIDPAAGGPQSDYAVVSIVRQRGCVTVSLVIDYFLRNAPRLVARPHELPCRLPRAVELHHELLPQVDKKPRDALRVSLVHAEHARLQPVVHVEQQEKHSQQVHVRRALHQRPNFCDLRARALREKLRLEPRERVLHRVFHPRAI
jgi:hypothetical protein